MQGGDYGGVRGDWGDFEGMVSKMREGNFNRAERAERVEKGLGVSSQELVSGEVIAHAKSAKGAKGAKSDGRDILTQSRRERRGRKV